MLTWPGLRLVASAFIVLGSVAGPAVADDSGLTLGSTTCGRGSCDLSAAKANLVPGLGGPVHSGSNSGSGGGGKPTCVPTPSSEVITSPSGERGQWYMLDCGQGTLAGQNFVGTPSGVPLWTDVGNGTEAVPAVDPRVLAAQAVSSLALPKPEVRLNPGAEGPQVVRVPTWLWVEPGQWQPVRATAEVPGVSVVAVATPTSVLWDMGDGVTVGCKSAGTPYSRQFDSASSSPDCGHTYLHSSGGEPDGSFAVSVTVHWSVRWSGAGQGGTFPDLTTESTLAVRVVEVQSLVTG